MPKIVVLNSGGFDSVVLMNYLRFIVGEEEIYSLHFLYGARNEKQQLECVNKVCEKCGAVNKVIQLPPIDWTHSNFFEGGEFNIDSQYLEYRNLIFLSYALSYAQSIGAKKIYLATLKSAGYIDTSEQFFRGLNSFSVPLSSIKIERPFAEFKDKTEELQYAIVTGVMPEDYFSCDKPINGEKCGKCLDCQSLEFIEEQLRVDTPFKALVQSGFNYEDITFKRLLKEVSEHREVRALINNDCQLRCKHCFYGFDEMVSDKLDKETYYKVLKDLVLEHGFTNIHFSGKEPLYDDSILWYVHKIKEDNLPCTFNLVTNGLNTKYYHELKECGIEKIFLSVDYDKNIRSCSPFGKALSVCREENIPVEVFIDLHEGNYQHIGYIIRELYLLFGVKNFFIRTIRSLGNASKQILLTGSNLYDVFKQVDEFTDKYKDAFVQYSLSSEYIPVVNSYEPLSELFLLMDSLYSVYYKENLFLFLERYCDRYHDITLTPDGYVLGCASEVSRPDYDKISAGNVLEKPLNEILNKGNELRCQCSSKFPCDNYSCMMNKIC